MNAIEMWALIASPVLLLPLILVVARFEGRVLTVERTAMPAAEVPAAEVEQLV